MKARKVDGNQKTLVDQLRRIPGLTVQHTHTIGNGFGDIVVGFKRTNYLFEIKDPSKPLSARKLTEDEKKFHEKWTGQIDVVETMDDVLRILKIKSR